MQLEYKRNYYTNGHLVPEGRYIDDKEEGPWRQWTEDGRLSPDTLWRNGEE